MNFPISNKNQETEKKKHDATVNLLTGFTYDKGGDVYITANCLRWSKDASA